MDFSGEQNGQFNNKLFGIGLNSTGTKSAKSFTWFLCFFLLTLKNVYIFFYFN